MAGKRTLIIGASGQIGTDLTTELRARLGGDQVVATDIRDTPRLAEDGPFAQLDILDGEALASIIRKYDVGEVYALAALLSATAESKPRSAWKLNMEGLLNVLDLAAEGHVAKVFWPSSIAVFGPDSPKQATPQRTSMIPTTIYGISKQAGEAWCQWYHQKKGVDVRSLRYPGLISSAAAPGGGTTDYAVEIFSEALTAGAYTCFLAEDQRLPMMYMPDAIRGTLELMQAPAENIRIRTAYNFSGIDFTPAELAEQIRTHIPGFKMQYQPDFRQAIASSWPDSIDDQPARQDWNWQPEHDLASMVRQMLAGVSAKVGLSFNNI